MKEIEVPTPGCNSCAKRKARRNPYRAIGEVMGWVKVIAPPVLMLVVIAAYAFLIVWGVQNGEFATVEVVETVQKPINEWIAGVAVLGGLAMIIAVIYFFASAMEIAPKWREQVDKWDRKRMEDR